jgi:hypothetical protein
MLWRYADIENLFIQVYFQTNFDFWGRCVIEKIFELVTLRFESHELCQRLQCYPPNAVICLATSSS